MTKTVTISDELAALLEARRRSSGFTTLDAAAEALIAQALVLDAQDDHSAGYTDEELRKLIQEAEESGPEEPWDPAEVRKELRRRFAATQRP